jgi:hypothetical protein
MNGTPRFTVTNPLAESIREGEDMINLVMSQAARLEDAIRYEGDASRAARLLTDDYDAAETEAMSEVIIMAAAKEGPLAGIAMSSKAFDIALNNQRAQLRRGKLADLWANVEDARMEHERAKTRLAEADAAFKAARVVCDLKSNILRAACI